LRLTLISAISAGLARMDTAIDPSLPRPLAQRFPRDDPQLGGDRIAV
jgi:hypothetical protein